MKQILLLLIFMISTTFVFSQTEKQKAEYYLKERGELVFTFTANTLEEVRELSRIISFDHGQDINNPLTINAIANNKNFQKFLSYNLPYTVPSEKNEPKEVEMYNSAIHGIQNRNANYTLAFPLSTYPTYADYAAQMSDFATDNPSIAELVDIGGTVQGDKRLLFIKLSDNVSTREQEPRVMYTSSMHGDEIAGFPSMLNLIDYFITAYNDIGHADHARVKNLLDNSEVWINPMANPDATYWLDNTNTSVSQSRRENANNVDLNRNYPDNVSGHHPDWVSYEIETSNFMALAENYHFVLSANFHGGAEVVNYPWDNTSVRHPDDAWYFLISKEYAVHCQTDGPSAYMDAMYTNYVWPGVTNGSDWYTVYGGRQDYMNYQHHAKELTIELSNVKTPPSTDTGADNEIIDIWNYNQNAYIDYLVQGTYGFQGVVKEVNTGDPIKAQITLVGQDDLGSWVETELPLGDYYRPINAGTYDILFEADCYNSFTLTNQTIADYETKVLADIYLTPKTPVFPYVENFDIGIGEWKQDLSDDGDWTLNSSSTPSNTTGPSDDFTVGGNYFYTEATDGSNPGFNATVNLISPCIDFTGYSSASFSFYYHMYGQDMGDLLLDVSDDMETTWTNLVTIAGEQQTAEGDPWLLQYVDLNAYGGETIKLRFSGQTGGGYRSDMAIDNIAIENAVLGTTSFEINEWSIYPNPSTIGLINIIAPSNVQEYDIMISNILGQQVHMEKVTSNSGIHVIYTKNIESGIYILQIETAKGNMSQKIIIE
ncbi:MAG: M14 family zinc carboxypeptidase [Urechidicola sp.]|nr:M14 family zinc carboxypeptidase [Urechidicola sp.]